MVERHRSTATPSERRVGRPATGVGGVAAIPSVGPEERFSE
jgi:hypothetical protein